MSGPGGGYIDKLKKRVGTLLIPYVLWAFVIPAIYLGLVYVVRHFYNGKDFSDLWILLSNPIKLNGPLWFLRNLIILALASPLVYYWITKTKIIGLIALGALYVADISIPVEGFEPVGWFFFSLGAYFQILGKDVLQSFSKYKIGVYVIGIILIVAMYAVRWVDYEIYKILISFFTIIGLIGIMNLTAPWIEKGKLRSVPILAETSLVIYFAHRIGFLEAAYLLLRVLIPIGGEIGVILRYLLQPWVISALIIMTYMLCKRFIPKITSIITGGRATIKKDAK